MYHTHTQLPGQLSASQIAMQQQLAQYDRVGEYRTPHSQSFASQNPSYPIPQYQRTYTPPASTSRPASPHISGGWGKESPRMRHAQLQPQPQPQSLYQSPPSSPLVQSRGLANEAIIRGVNAYDQLLATPTGHGHLVPLKSAQTPPQTTSTAMVIAGHHQQQPPHQHQQLVLAPQPSAPVLAPQPTVAANIVTANPVPTSSTPPAQAPAPVDSSSASIVAAAPPTQEPKSNTILIHIPLIPTPFRIAIDAVAPKNGVAVPYSLTDKINSLLMNQSIQERIHNALSVPKPNGWILVERVNTEFLQLRDLLGAIKEGRLMGEGVIPWVCAGELVEGGVGYWCLGVCT
ncbi:hypothetical protein L211DRAFT_844833 [Terfezia boudieri ATCC MYA-4762]|uniref:Uncharacterized protein n=1 Tax=Terfezia boudieri ATCC MYA-4762 TaxID=1051890 RepID=A0A3N4M4J6_9PEZI|nr:hypothetical protein L211DRAFT_844833 [Terfezia boudieri ATCC MYA-4762]